MKKIYCIETEGICSEYHLNYYGKYVYRVLSPGICSDNSDVNVVFEKDELCEIAKRFLANSAKSLLKKKPIYGVIYYGTDEYDGEDYKVVIRAEVCRRILEVYWNDIKLNMKSFFTKRLGK